MILSTKATIKRLENIVKANDKEYDTNKEYFCRLMLEWIKEADRNKIEFDEYLQYDSKDSAYNFWNRCMVRYCGEGLYISNRYDLYTQVFYCLEAKYNNLVRFMHCLDLQYCVIKDVNKLVKLIIAEE